MQEYGQKIYITIHHVTTVNERTGKVTLLICHSQPDMTSTNRNTTTGIIEQLLVFNALKKRRTEVCTRQETVSHGQTKALCIRVPSLCACL